MRYRKFVNKMKKDREGIEGLPLKLLIVVIITVVALGIIMVWLGQIGGPQSIDKVKVEPTAISLGGSDSDTVTINITVYDSNNNRLEGVYVSLNGANATRQSFQTDSNGFVSITTYVELPPGVDQGKITVTAQKSDYNDKTVDIPVFRY